MKYTLVQSKYIDEIKSEFKLYKHEKSGARVLILKNDDKNKVFSIGFRTPPQDSTGVPHILEHSTLCGSEKYPVKDPFVELLKGSLSTFLNAMTYPDKTLYPVASCNNQDFKNLMSVYMDAVFKPNVYKYEEIFKQEGWHFELENIDDPLKYNGVVYNEMKGVYSSSDEILYDQAVRGLYPDTTYGYDSGGNPTDIPNLTYQKFTEFHKKYYSPSNSYIYLYGDLDVEERLEWLDNEYLSKYDVIDPNSKIEYQKPFEKEKDIYITYPISKNENLEKKTNYSFSTVIGDYKDKELIFAFKTLSYVLFDAQGSPLRKAFVENEFCEDINIGFNDEIMQPNLTVLAKNADDNALDEFKSILNTTFKQIVKEGIDKDALKGYINCLSFKYVESDFGSTPKGLVFCNEIMNTWLYDDNNPIDRLETRDLFADLLKKVDTNYYEELVEKYLINNNNVLYVAATPDPEYQDREELVLEDKLKRLKDEMSLDELNKMIEDTKALKKYQSTESTKEELNTLPKLTREDISVDVEPFNNRVKKVDDIDVVYHDYETNNICYLNVLFKMDDLSNDELLYTNLFTDIIGNVDTDIYTYQEIDKLININTGELSCSVTSRENDEKIPMGYISFNSKFFYGKEKFVFDMIQNQILKSKIDTKKRVKEKLFEFLSFAKQGIMGNGHNFSFNRAMSYISPSAKYDQLLYGLDFYNEMVRIGADFDNNYQFIIDKFNNIATKVFRKDKMIVSVNGNNLDYDAEVKELANSLNNTAYEKGSFEFKKEILNEAFVIPGKVNYVARAVSCDKDIYNGAARAFETSLKYDYLWTKVRVLGGAYGAIFRMKYTGDYGFVSYRDPNVKNTLDIYSNVDEYLETFSPDDDKLTQYIIGALRVIQIPLTPSMLGDRSMSAYLTDSDINESIKRRNELINADAQTVKSTMQKLFNEMNNTDAICVIGTEKSINECKELFGIIKNL